MGRTTEKKQDVPVRWRDDRRKLMALALVGALSLPALVGIFTVLQMILD